MTAKWQKIGTLKVPNGTYEENGKTKNRYHEIGVLLSTPHASQLVIKLHATATSEPKVVSVFLDDGKKLTLENQAENLPREDEVGF